MTNGRALQTRVCRVGEQGHTFAGDPLTGPSTATPLAVDRLSLVSGAGSGVPVGVHHQVGHGARRQDGVVATCLQVDVPLGPAEPLCDRLVHHEGVDVGEVTRGAADPGAARERGVLAGAAVVAGRLDVAQPQPRRGAEVRRRVVVADEAVEHPAFAPGPAERLTQGGREGVEHMDVGRRGGVVPVSRRLAGGEVLGILGRSSGAGGRVGRLDQGSDLGLGGRAAAHRARCHTVSGADEADHGDTESVHDAVGGQRVVGPAQVRARRVGDDRDAVIGRRGRQGVLDQRLRGPGVRGHQWPASSVVLRIRTSRKSAVGQPWLTAATCPGCALPQLNAPPRTQVSSPPTAAMEFQKSVVVAW